MPEEPLLDRRQWRRTGDHRVSLCGLRTLRTRDHGKLLHGAALEDVAWLDREPGSPRLRDDLDGEDRVATQLEIVVVAADALQLQRASHDLAQDRLGVALRRLIRVNDDASRDFVRRR